MPTFDLRPPTAEHSPQPPPDVSRTAPPAPLTWEAPEYRVRPKSVLWYVSFGTALAVFLFIAFLMRSFLTGVVFGLLGFLVLLFSERPPRTIRFAVSAESLSVNDRKYPLNELEAFNVVDSLLGTGVILIVRSRRVVMPLVHVPLMTQDPDAIRGLLRTRLHEDLELRESFTDILAHRLGF